MVSGGRGHGTDRVACSLSTERISEQPAVKPKTSLFTSEQKQKSPPNQPTDVDVERVYYAWQQRLIAEHRQKTAFLLVTVSALILYFAVWVNNDLQRSQDCKIGILTLIS